MQDECWPSTCLSQPISGTADHLTASFYISRPRQIYQSEVQSEEEVETEKEIQENKTTDVSAVATRKQSPHTLPNHKVIKAMHCSPPLSIHLVKKKLKRQERSLKTTHKFMKQFDNFFKFFIPSENQDPKPLPKRRLLKKETKILWRKKKEEVFEYESEQEEFHIKKVQPVNYYDKLKTNVELKIEHLIKNNSPTCNQGSKKVQTKPKGKKTVDKVLKEKSILKKKESRMRLSRSGLMITLDTMEQKESGGNLIMIENLKTKKDMNFRRCLAKNCQVVLSNFADLQKDDETPCRSSIQPKNMKTYRKYRSSLENTFHREECFQGKDIEVLKLREKCMKIGLTCNKNYKNNKNIKQGLHIFGKYCDKLHSKYSSCQKKMKKFLFEERDEDSAEAIYNSMSNVNPLSNYLKSLQ